MEAGTHLALELASHSGGGDFVWNGVSFTSDTVQVTCLQWVAQLGCLAAGYNLGVWSLVSLAGLAPAYTSSVPDPSTAAPVTGLAWQEPLDDPRHYSYVWALRAGSSQGLATASLYSLAYRHRGLESVEGPSYEGLESVALRFEHPLTGEHDTETMVSRVVSVDTLDLGLATGGCQDRSGDTDQPGERDLSLAVLVWEVTDPAADTSTTYMGLWDINCWYQAQMPSSVDELGMAGGLCPYLSVCEVGGVDVTSLQVEPHTITKFGAGAGQGAEQLFYPSSLKFNLNIVTPEGYFQVWKFKYMENGNMVI